MDRPVAVHAISCQRQVVTSNPEFAGCRQHLLNWPAKSLRVQHDTKACQLPVLLVVTLAVIATPSYLQHIGWVHVTCYK